jgi:hypothetical protein
VKISHGPAAVKEESFLKNHWETGKVEKMLKLESEDLPIFMPICSTKDGEGI